MLSFSETRNRTCHITVTEILSLQFEPGQKITYIKDGILNLPRSHTAKIIFHVLSYSKGKYTVDSRPESIRANTVSSAHMDSYKQIASDMIIGTWVAVHYMSSFELLFECRMAVWMEFCNSPKCRTGSMCRDEHNVRCTNLSSGCCR